MFEEITEDVQASAHKLDSLRAIEAAAKRDAERIAAKSKFHEDRVASAEHALAEVVAAREIHRAKLDEARAVVDAATAERQQFEDTHNAFVGKIREIFADTDAAVGAIESRR